MFQLTFPFLRVDVSIRTCFGNSETFWCFVQLRLMVIPWAKALHEAWKMP